MYFNKGSPATKPSKPVLNNYQSDNDNNSTVNNQANASNNRSQQRDRGEVTQEKVLTPTALRKGNGQSNIQPKPTVKGGNNFELKPVQEKTVRLDVSRGDNNESVIMKKNKRKEEKFFKEFHYYKVLLYFFTAFTGIYAYYFLMQFTLELVVNSSFFEGTNILAELETQQGSFNLTAYILITFASFTRATFNLIFLIIGIHAYNKKSYGTNKCFGKFLEVTIFAGLLGLGCSMFCGLTDLFYSLFSTVCLLGVYKSCDNLTTVLFQMRKNEELLANG